MNYTGLILHWVSSLVADAESRFGPKKGAIKKDYVTALSVKLFERKHIIGGNPDLDITELIKLIGAVIDAVVALLNFLGLFKKDAPTEEEKGKE